MVLSAAHTALNIALHKHDVMCTGKQIFLDDPKTLAVIMLVL